MSAPLAGLRVIESSLLGPGAISMHLADLGAEVIKVESPAGGYIREMTWPIVEGVSLLHLHVSRGKKSITLDLKNPEGVAIYLDLVRGFNAKGSLKVYPGSPFIIQQLLRERDKLKLFELHPTDAKTLSANVAQLEAGRQVAVLREDGFEALKKFLPPPQRRALVLCDPSYEIKMDYQRVSATMADALARFATGTYVVWYPIIPRPEAHDLPRKLKTLANKTGKPWLNAALTVKSSKILTSTTGEETRPGLPASGMFVINPPHTLKAALQAALPQMVALLGQDRHAQFAMESGG